MWEFMSNYSDSFWKTGEYAWEVFEVIMAWAVTLGFTKFIIEIIAAVGKIIADEIKKLKRGGKGNDTGDTDRDC